jgi:hypothetical protein
MLIFKYIVYFIDFCGRGVTAMLFEQLDGAAEFLSFGFFILFTTIMVSTVSNDLWQIIVFFMILITTWRIIRE